MMVSAILLVVQLALKTPSGGAFTVQGLRPQCSPSNRADVTRIRRPPMSCPSGRLCLQRQLHSQTNHFRVIGCGQLQLSTEEAGEIEPGKKMDESSGWRQRISKYFKNSKKDDGLTTKQRLAKLGVACVLSYGVISNLSYGILVSMAWFAFSKQTGLSPLAKGQWKGFLAVYSGFWIFNNVIRPLRCGLAVAIAPTLDKLVLWVQDRTKWSKSLAITATVVVINIIGTTLLMVGGVALASLLAGVPVFPTKP